MHSRPLERDGALPLSFAFSWDFDSLRPAPPRQWPAVLAAVALHGLVAGAVYAWPREIPQPPVMVIDVVIEGEEMSADPAPELPATAEPAAAAPQEPAEQAAEPPPEPEPAPEPTPEPVQPPPPPKPQPPRPAPRPSPPAKTALSRPIGGTAPAQETARPAGTIAEAPLVPPSGHADYLNNPRPAYPPAARRRGLQGVVVLAVVVAADGQPRTVTLHSSSGSPMLDDAALQAVRGWRFVPATRGGHAVEASVEVPVRFSLNDS